MNDRDATRHHPDVPAGVPDVSDAAEEWQLQAEAEAPTGPLDGAEFLLWHFAINSRDAAALTIHRSLWLQYCRTLRALIAERDRLKYAWRGGE